MKSSIVKEFSKRLRKSGILFAVQQGISIPFQVLIAVFTGGMVTSAISGEGTVVLQQGVWLLVSVVLYKLVETLLKIRYNQVLTKARQGCRMKLYRWYMENPLYKLYSFEQGNFLERINDDFSAIVGKFSNYIPLLFVNILASIVYFVYVGIQSWSLALLFLAMALVQMVPELLIKRLEEKIYEENRDVEAKVTEWTVAAYRGFSTIKNFNLTEWYMQKLKKLHDEYLKIGSWSIGVGTAESSAQQLISYLLQYGVCVVAGLFVWCEKLPLSGAIVAIAVSGSFFSAVKTLFAAIPEFAVVNVAEKRLEEWKVETEESRRLMGDTGVSLSDVSFSYGEKQVLCHKNAALETDGICIIKGENGSGKSSLLKLIAGLISCEEGYIAVGKDVADIPKQLQDGQRILYLAQERLHMDITVEEYIGLFSGLDESEWRKNLQDFHIGEEFLQCSLNDLSGGEEKKIMLSVMLATKAPLLLLDEPETSLDVEGQRVLARKLKERGRGVLMITHGEMFDGIANRIYQMKVGGSLSQIGCEIKLS